MVLVLRQKTRMAGTFCHNTKINTNTNTNTNAIAVAVAFSLFARKTWNKTSTAVIWLVIWWCRMYSMKRQIGCMLGCVWCVLRPSRRIRFDCLGLCVRFFRTPLH